MVELSTGNDLLRALKSEICQRCHQVGSGTGLFFVAP